MYLLGYEKGQKITTSYNGDLWWLFSGAKFKYTYAYIPVNGHTWVTDGYKVFDRYAWFQWQHVYKDKVSGYTTKIGDPPYRGRKETIKYLHMNWGWDKYTKNKIKGATDDWITYDYWRIFDRKEGKIKLDYNYQKQMMTIQK